MKSVFKILLLTILSCCYLNTVFELCDTEKKANYESESHNYIQQDSHSLSFAFSKTVKQLDNNFSHILPVNFVAAETVNSFRISYGNYFSPPPRKRFILYASLLI